MTELNDISKWRVLIVDDEPDNLKLASEFLTFSGAFVVTASSGEQVLRTVHDVKPTIVLLDLSMPGTDGWEVQRRLREQPQLSHVPIIALTAMAMPEDIARAREVGFDGYITKPFRVMSLLRDLVACVHQFTARNIPTSSFISEDQHP